MSHSKLTSHNLADRARRAARHDRQQQLVLQAQKEKDAWLRAKVERRSTVAVIVTINEGD
jgi:hypothetical protein